MIWYSKNRLTSRVFKILEKVFREVMVLSKMVQKKKKANGIRKKTGSSRSVRVSASSGNKKAKSSPSKKRQHREFTGVILIALSILFGLSIYMRNITGIVGEIILHVLTGLFGFVSFIMPPLIFVYGLLHIFYPQRPRIRNKVLLVFLLFIIIGAIFQAGSFDRLDYVNMSLFQYLKVFYQEGRGVAKLPYTINSGVVGGIISAPLCFLLQKTGTIIVLATSGIIIAMIITEISIKRTFVRTADKVRNISIPLADTYDDDTVEQEETVFLKELDEHIGMEKPKRVFSKGNIIDFPLNKRTTEQDDSFISEEKKKNGEIETAARPKSRKISGAAKKVEKPLESDVRVKPMQGKEYHFPPFSCLKAPDDEGVNTRKLRADALENARKLEETLINFGISVQVVNVAVGPAFTRFELQPSPGVKVSRIVNLADDIALSLAAQGIRIEAPIPGKAAVGIEVPNNEVAPIRLREVLETPDFVKYKSRLAVGLGKDISGENTIIDLAKMPHLLIAGATGSGKSVCINCIIISLLYKATPEEVKLVLIDPKVVELGGYNGIPHLLIPVVTDPAKAAGALQWAVQEMTNRYKLFAEKGVRDLAGYNRAVKDDLEAFKLPQIVIIIDELADLMMVAPHDVEDSICRLAQMARAAGMYLVIATQRPSVNVITGVIKANIPSRIAFAVSSQVDSRTILDMGGAEKLLGKGDMLYYPVGTQKPIRVKGAFVNERDVESVVNYVKSQVIAEYDEDVIEKITAVDDESDKTAMDADELLPQAIELVISCGQASVSLIQRRFKVGYARAGRIVDQMAERGIISGFEGSKPRRVLISKEQWEEMKMGGIDRK
jgi:S-DNA-T family DNA segregation ATPase FtsK/SpoIIIE